MDLYEPNVTYKIGVERQESEGRAWFVKVRVIMLLTFVERKEIEKL